MPPAARRLEPAEHDPTEISAADAVTFAPNVTVWVAQNWRGFPLSATIGGILHPAQLVVVHFVVFWVSVCSARPGVAAGEFAP
jgi:hypothetical protein